MLYGEFKIPIDEIKLNDYEQDKSALIQLSKRPAISIELNYTPMQNYDAFDVSF